MKMMFASNWFPCLLLAILVPAASETIEEKTNALLTFLDAVDSELGGVLDVTDDQCPCLDDVTLIGNETIQDVDCFETKVEVFRSHLNNLIRNLQSLGNASSSACPNRTGSVFVAACDSTTVSELDPNGVVQNGFELSSNISGWTVGPTTASSFEFDYFANDPFVLRCLQTPSGVEVILGNSSDAPLTASAVGTGIVYFEPTNEVYVAITFDNSSLNGVYAFNRTGFPDIRLVFPFDGPTGLLYLSGDFLYMADGLKVVRITEGDTSWTTIVFWPIDPIAFAVDDDENIVFCDGSGSLFVFKPAIGSFMQLKVPTPGLVCGSIDLSSDGLIYVAYDGQSNLEVYNSSSNAFIENLNYTLDVPTVCPIVLVDPRI
ncbi:uncharacterized protein LOC124111307 [Haliotis rufescens]|uniref:uncharacterized protein LOC124111307 n=1 Tax=Haliotis rufescens TaxID=6454 RepID=UPI001EB06AEC|nr:uncharacterized protein LOC124111307 [Haliotis rufescens]